MGGGERGVVDFGKLFTETNEQKFSLGEVQCKWRKYVQGVANPQIDYG